MALDLRSTRHDLKIHRGQTLAFSGVYGASLTGATVRATIQETGGTKHQATCTITDAGAGEYTIVWSSGVTRGIREGRHRWGVEIEQAGIVTPICHGEIAVDTEVVG